MPNTWKGGKPQKKFPPPPQAITKIELLVLALLISDAAAGLASRLAGSLALAASAVLCAIAQVARLKRFDTFHTVIPLRSRFIIIDYITFF